jgi:quercetin dioxygenase-like cupin family protein
MAHPTLMPAAEAIPVRALVASVAQGTASRVLAKTSGGTVTLFAFDAGQELSEHTAPFDALVMVLDGLLTLTIGGQLVTALPGTMVRMPAHIPHAVEAVEPTTMLLIMLRESGERPV